MIVAFSSLKTAHGESEPTPSGGLVFNLTLALNKGMVVNLGGFAAQANNKTSIKVL